jgi:hypothetical protein
LPELADLAQHGFHTHRAGVVLDAGKIGTNGEQRNLIGVRGGIRRNYPFAQPPNKRRFVIGMKEPEAAVIANLCALVSLCAFAPVSVVKKGAVRYARLSGEVAYDSCSDLLRRVGETPVHLKGFQQDGEAQASRPDLVPTAVRAPVPTVSSAVQVRRVPVLLHASSRTRKLFAEGAYREPFGVF